MNTLTRIERLSHDKAQLESRLGETIDALLDLARICDAVRYSAGLGKGQLERVEKARTIAAKADAALAEIRQLKKEAT